MIDDLRSNAANEHSRKLADKLAQEWQVDKHWPHPAPAQDLAELAAWRRKLEPMGEPT